MKNHTNFSNIDGLVKQQYETERLIEKDVMLDVMYDLAVLEANKIKTLDTCRIQETYL
jgi:hypothetical protein